MLLLSTTSTTVVFTLFISRNDKGDTLNASYYHIVKPLTNTYVGAEANRSFSTNENTLTVGPSILWTH
nr:mitochondrial outer membrane protein porin of 34 kDa-like [Tanacetum cinerariifolium]